MTKHLKSGVIRFAVHNFARTIPVPQLTDMSIVQESEHNLPPDAGDIPIMFSTTSFIPGRHATAVRTRKASSRLSVRPTIQSGYDATLALGVASANVAFEVISGTSLASEISSARATLIGRITRLAQARRCDGGHADSHVPLQLC